MNVSAGQWSRISAIEQCWRWNCNSWILYFCIVCDNLHALAGSSVCHTLPVVYQPGIHVQYCTCAVSLTLVTYSIVAYFRPRPLCLSFWIYQGKTHDMTRIEEIYRIIEVFTKVHSFHFCWHIDRVVSPMSLIFLSASMKRKHRQLSNVLSVAIFMRYWNGKLNSYKEMKQRWRGSADAWAIEKTSWTSLPK